MFPRFLALVSETERVTSSELARVAAALNKQATRDITQLWGVQASVDAFINLEDVPLGYWPMIVRDDIGFPGAAGIHLDEDGQPFALIQHSNSWSLTASHEAVEMMVDPLGDRLIAGPSLKEDQGRVEYLVEVADPSEAAEFGYTINGILMSDFYGPRFFDPVAAQGVQYSFTGAITEPRQVLRGGYISWHEPISGHWWQLLHFEAEPEFLDLGRLDLAGQSIRSLIDSHTVVPEQVSGVAPENRQLQAAIRAGEATETAANSKAESWRRQIEQLIQDASR
jgi:hypothetical protein